MEQIIRRILLYLSASRFARWCAVRFPLTRKVSRRFVAGETLEDALTVVRDLRRQGFLTSLDLLGENVDGLGEAEEATREVLRAIEALQSEGLACNVSIKLTQLGLDEGLDVVRHNLTRIAQSVDSPDIKVRIDMEGSRYTQSTLDLVVELHREYPFLATVLQSYLHRTFEDVLRLNENNIAVRLCKGAYAEPQSLAFQDKHAVDEAYLRAADELLLNGVYPAFATHDEAMIEGVLGLVTARDLKPEEFEFQMLYGIRQDRQRELLEQGYRVRLYVPYGKSWYPYFMRRLAERPANLGFFLTALVRG